MLHAIARALGLSVPRLPLRLNEVPEMWSALRHMPTAALQTVCEGTGTALGMVHVVEPRGLRYGPLPAQDRPCNQAVQGAARLGDRSTQPIWQ